MSKPVMQHDANGEPIQALCPEDGTCQNGALAGTSARVAIPSGSDVVRIATTGNCYIKFGTVTVTSTANDILFPTGAEYYRVLPEWTHVAWIAAGGDTGVFSVTRMI